MTTSVTTASQHPIRLTLRGEIKSGATVQAVLSIGHPMESGFRRQDSGDVIAKHVIEHIRVSLVGGAKDDKDGKDEQFVWEAKTGIGISANPYFSFGFTVPQTPSDKPWRVVVTWRDDKNITGRLERELSL